eukprot:3804636-Pyramimonas_sp.AAC.1
MPFPRPRLALTPRICPSPARDWPSPVEALEGEHLVFRLRRALVAVVRHFVQAPVGVCHSQVSGDDRRSGPQLQAQRGR